jgi:tetratricopeptide (TPR) repeat protein
MAPAALARWRQELASQLVMSEHPRAPDAARAARATYRTLGDDPGLYSATCALVRSLGRPGAELDEACAEMRALLARHPEWDTRKRLLAAGAFALAAAVRGDKVEQLVQRRAEVELAREMGAQNSLDAAETNVVTALLDLGRIDEAIALATGLVQRIGDDESANAAYAWAGLVIALIQAGRYEQALAAAPRARAAGQRFDLPLLVDTLALMAVHRDHPRAAARLLGYARHAYSSRSMLPEISVRERLEQVAAFARSRLDEATVARLITEGNTLDDAAADRLAFAGDDQD